MAGRLITILALGAALGLAAPSAHAATEVGDAGQLPASAQDVTLEAVTTITGSLGTPSDVDLYEVCLTGGATFSASTVGGATLDTQLFLFTEAGLGVYANDDHGAGVRQSLLPAGSALTPGASGIYYLAVSQFNLDPQSSLGPIFPSTLGLIGPTGRGGAEPLSGWAGSFGSGGAYTVTLTGTEACGVVRDTTSPEVTIASPADGLEVELGTEVAVDFSCSDEGGSELASCEGSVPDGSLLDTSNLGATSVTVTARDNAGNETVVTHDVEVVDETAPSVVVESPVDGAVYQVGEQVSAAYSCGDDGSGVESCVGDVPAGEPLDTSSPGLRTFTVTAVDEAGNETTASVDYRVGYDFGGFLWPLVNLPELNGWKAGQRVPVRFSLGGDQGLDAVVAIEVVEVDCGAGEEPASGEPARLGRRLTYRERTGVYRFSWRTARAWSESCRQLLVKLDDDSVQRAEFRFVRRWHELLSDDD